MKKLPIGIQTFKDIVTDNYVYVDKTETALNLINRGRYFFLSRPRRFGKSLFLDTLKDIFEAEKELFKGLYIYDKYDWSEKYPVIKISFGAGVVESVEGLDRDIINIIKFNQRRLDIICEDLSDAKGCLQELIELAYRKYNKKVVILVDEYDKPILDNIENPDLAIKIRNRLKNIYSVIKDSDAFIRFAFLTGVSKFSKVSLFSGLNNLEDITLDEKYATICGYTQEDIETDFKKHLQGVDLEELKRWYNGYNFLGKSVYNPFDILLFISKGHDFRNYWFETGTPSFLIKLLRKNNYFIPHLSTLKVGEDILGSFDIDDIKIETLLFQTGYLTIKEKKRAGTIIRYLLKYPNLEVEYSLHTYIIDYLTNSPIEKASWQSNIYIALENSDFNQLKDTLFTLFASIPYHNFTNNKIYEYEGYYASVMYSYFASLGLELIPEDVTNKGRIDLTLKFPNNEKVYIFEFKVNENDTIQHQALAQIKAKKYYEKYNDVDEIYLIGIDFSRQDKNISGFEWEQYMI